MRKLFFLLPVLLFTSTSCDVFNNEQGILTVEVQATEMKIANGFNRDVYFAAYRSVDLVHILVFLTSSEEMKIEAGKVQVFQNNETISEELESGQNITVFYWFSEDPQDEGVSRIHTSVK